MWMIGRLAGTRAAFKAYAYAYEDHYAYRDCAYACSF